MTQIAKAHCHKLVAETAKDMAHNLYSDLMANNQLYSAWKTQNPGLTGKALENRFVAKNWGKCLEAARAMLALMLRGPCDESLKSTIHEALVLDATLIRGRAKLAARGLQ